MKTTKLWSEKLKTKLTLYCSYTSKSNSKCPDLLSLIPEGTHGSLSGRSVERSFSLPIASGDHGTCHRRQGLYPPAGECVCMCVCVCVCVCVSSTIRIASSRSPLARRQRQWRPRKGAVMFSFNQVVGVYFEERLEVSVLLFRSKPTRWCTSSLRQWKRSYPACKSWHR